MTNDQIIKSFINHGGDTNQRKPLSVCNGKLYSYSVVIAEYVVESGFQGILIHDHWSKGLGWLSSTTSQHVGLIMRETKHFPRKVKSEESEKQFFLTDVKRK